MHKDFRVMREVQELQVHKVNLVLLDQRESQEILAQLVQLELRAPKDQMEHRVHKELPVQGVIQGQQDQRDQVAQLGQLDSKVIQV